MDALHLDANYVRRTDAEVKWQDAKSKVPALIGKAHEARDATVQKW